MRPFRTCGYILALIRAQLVRSVLVSILTYGSELNGMSSAHLYLYRLQRVIDGTMRDI